MLTYSHVVTTGTADNAFLSNLTDLAIVWFGGRLVLVSSNTYHTSMPFIQCKPLDNGTLR